MKDKDSTYQKTTESWCKDKGNTTTAMSKQNKNEMCKIDTKQSQKQQLMQNKKTKHTKHM